MRACKRQGCTVLLFTSEKLRDKDWPHESIDETFYIPGEQDVWNMEQVITGLAYVLRQRKVDKLVALDDFDVEKVASLREEFRVPGMGQTRARYFRDKLAMRMLAHEHNILVPAFTPVFNDAEVHRFATEVAPPWVLKPRSAASAIGIKKIHSEQELWEVLARTADERHQYVLEQFRPGDVYHVDTLIYDYKVQFSRVHRYMDTPFEVANHGGIFRTHTVPYGSEDDLELTRLNKEVLKVFGMKEGASHTEFIKSKEDGKFYFLETSARVGGAHIVEMVEGSSGINLWAEWARIETLEKGEKYQAPKVRKEYSGIIISLAKQQNPDISGYNDPEIFWKMNMDFHAGLVVRSDKLERVEELLNNYAQRFGQEFYTYHPPREKPSN